jgi:hypothetical protein
MNRWKGSKRVAGSNGREQDGLGYMPLLETKPKVPESSIIPLSFRVNHGT